MRFQLAAFLALTCAVANPLLADEEAPKKPTEVAVFTLSGPVIEKPVADDMPFSFSGSMPDSFLSLTTRLRKAVDDDNLAAVVFLPSGNVFGYAQIEEFRAIIKELRDAGKDVYVHADSWSTGLAATFSGASHVAISPTGIVNVTGLYGELFYLRGLFDKLGVTPDFVTMGAYKSAAETYMRTGPSKEAAEMSDWLYDSIYDSIVKGVADGRGVSDKQARELIDVGLYGAKEAQEAGLIDAVQFRQQFEAQLKEKFGSEITFNKRYGRASQKQLDMSSPFAVMQLWAELLGGGRRSSAPKKDAVAVVYVEGAIMAGSAPQSLFGSVDGAFSEPIRKALDAAARDDSVKAVVLRVDSPGGSATASEIILDATRRVKARKPLIVSMGNVAGSGGYYVSVGGGRIFADPATITGSIGVLSGKLVTTNMWDKTGIRFVPVQRGKNSDIFSSATKFRDDQREHMLTWMNSIYDEFKGHVKAARGDRLSKPLEEMAGGRVFTGVQAKELGLVDELGGLHDAIASVAKEASLEKYEVRVIPRPKNFAELLMGDTGGSSKPARHLSVSSSLAKSPLWQSVIPLLEGLDPERVRLVQQAIQQLEIANTEKVSLSMPILQTR